MPGAGEHVLGIEPANCNVRGAPLRADGSLVTLEPGQSQRFELQLDVETGADQRRSFRLALFANPTYCIPTDSVAVTTSYREIRLCVLFNCNASPRTASPSSPDDGQALHIVAGDGYLSTLALEAHRTGVALAGYVHERLTGETVDYDEVIADKRILPPLDHPDPAHLILSWQAWTISAAPRRAMPCTPS